MIGYQWTIYQSHCYQDSDGILACGITDNPCKAKSLVELVLTEVDHAAWGLLLRVAFDTDASPAVTEDLPDWPPAGEIQICRRAADDGFRWAPLYPR